MLRLARPLATALLIAATACTPVGQTGSATQAPPGRAAATPGATPDAPPPVAAPCRAPATPTLAQTEGPFFRTGSPERSVIADAAQPGVRLVLHGDVRSRTCAPVAGARIEVWQADASGRYDNTGFTLRGHVRSDAQGRYRLETIVPGEYSGRTPHLHVKVVPGSGATLTTQLYFPDFAARNAQDRIFRPELLVTYESGTTPRIARFDLILDAP